MKKALFISLFFVSIGYSQFIFDDTLNSTGYKRRVATFVNSTSSMGTGPLPVQIMGTSTGTTSNTYSRIDTAATGSDYITPGFNISKVDIVNVGSQIVYFCVDNSFGNNKIPIPPGGTYSWQVRATTIYYKSAASTSIVYMVAQ